MDKIKKHLIGNADSFIEDIEIIELQVQEDLTTMMQINLGIQCQTVCKYFPK